MSPHPDSYQDLGFFIYIVVQINSIMKKILHVLAVVPLLLILTGCPLSLSEPIDQPSVAVDPSWLGVYHGSLPTDYPFSTSINRWEVSKLSEHTYQIVGRATGNPVEMQKNKSTGSTSNDEITYSAFVSLIEGQTFLNVFNSDYNYSFYKIETVSNGMLLKEISATLFSSVENAEQLRTTIKKNIDKDELYGLSFTMERK